MSLQRLSIDLPADLMKKIYMVLLGQTCLIRLKEKIGEIARGVKQGVKG